MMSLSLILWFLIIALVCLAVYLAGRANTHVGRGKQAWLLVTYFAVLLCSPLALWLLPPERLPATVDATALRKAETVARDLFPATMAGKPESVDGVRKLGEWRFNFAGESLKITGNLPHVTLNLFVERKDENDGLIELTHYFTGAIMDMIDVSAQVRPVESTFAESTLLITEPEQYKIELFRFSRDAMAAQILGGDSTAWQPFRIDVISEQLLYLRIPQGVQIEKSDYHLQFVDQN